MSDAAVVQRKKPEQGEEEINLAEESCGTEDDPELVTPARLELLAARGELRRPADYRG